MKQYKKRTIALVIASVISVVGAFGAGNYKNSIMSLTFETEPSDAVSMTILTKTNYTSNITTVKKDASTYVIMLPDTNSLMSKSPVLSGNVESVDVKTMPYTTTGNGYTKITVKTLPNTILSAKNAIFVPEKKTEKLAPVKEKTIDEQPTLNTKPIQNNNTTKPIENTAFSEKPNNIPKQNTENLNTQNFTKDNTDSTVDKPITTNSQDNSAVEKDKNQLNNEISESSNDVLYVVLGTLLMLIVITYLFIRGKNKMSEIVGEQSDIDLSDNSERIAPKENTEKNKKIRKTINSLDKMYKKPVRMPISELSENEKYSPVDDTKISEDSNIVDLDELFQEQSGNSQKDEENNIFDDFLDNFLLEEKAENEAKALLEEAQKYNEELFNKFINDDSIRFSKADIAKIDKLLNIELSDEVLNNLEAFAPSEPTKPDKEKSLNKMITELAVSQNIVFSHEDVDALDKLMNVELDSDFVTDLSTNPKRTGEMTWEILNHVNKKHDTREIITINVKDSLPDLSIELKKNKNKKIESNAQPQTIFFEEGYEVMTFSAGEMPDLGMEIKNKNNSKNEFRPSDDIIWQDEWLKTYDTPTINVAEELPNLEDVKKHPKKYEDKIVPVKVDEKKLAKNLEGVVFKPFYDGNEESQIFDESDIVKNVENDNLLDFNTEQELIFEPESNDIIDEFKETPQEEITLDEAISALEDNKSFELVNLEHKDKIIKKRRTDEKTQELLQKIKNKQLQKVDENEINATEEEKPVVKETAAKPIVKSCILNGIEYNILASSNFAQNIGCYLATSNEEGYSILGFAGDKIFKIKQYEKVQNYKLQGRMSEKLDDGTLRYIVRIGIHKFILNVKDENMEYVMDLC